MNHAEQAYLIYGLSNQQYPLGQHTITASFRRAAQAMAIRNPTFQIYDGMGIWWGSILLLQQKLLLREQGTSDRNKNVPGFHSAYCC
jgi:hypothetical protein